MSVTVSLSISLTPLPSFASAFSCRSLFESIEKTPAGLVLRQVGPQSSGAALGVYSFDQNRWWFEDFSVNERFYPHLEEQSLAKTQKLLGFTYDVYGQRAFRDNGINQTEFLAALKREDGLTNFNKTSFLSFHIGTSVVGTVKISVRKPDDRHPTPVEAKVPAASRVLDLKFPGETLIELGRLAKIKELSIKTIFSEVSHTLLQRRIQRGAIIGHAAKAQARIYESLGFEIVEGPDVLGEDNYLVAMPVAKFFRLFPPRNHVIVRPVHARFMDENYLVGEPTPYLEPN